MRVTTGMTWKGRTSRVFSTEQREEITYFHAITVQKVPLPMPLSMTAKDIARAVIDEILNLEKDKIKEE